MYAWKWLKKTDYKAPALYDTTGSINTVRIAWDEWNSGSGGETIADRIRGIKADTSLAVGSRNSSLHKKKRHLPQLIESLIYSGATAEEAVSLMTQVAEHYELTLDQVREGARLLAIKTGKTDDDTLTAETAVTVGQFKQGISWVHCQVQASRQQQCLTVNEAEAHLSGSSGHHCLHVSCTVSLSCT